MEINRTSKPSWIGFHFEPKDYERWGKDRLDEFRAELKSQLPRDAWRYNDQSNWWSIRREYEYIFDQLRARYFKDERQGGLFE